MTTAATLAGEQRLPAAQPRLWLLALIAWTALGLVSAAQNAVFAAYQGRPIEWFPLLPTTLADWYTCGIFTPAFYWMVRRFPIRGRQWLTSLGAHLAASLAFVPLKLALFTPIFNALNPEMHRSFTGMLAGAFYSDLLGYWAAVGVLHAIAYYGEAQERAVVGIRLDAALRAAELENLKAQLQPHFLFNTIQAISTLIHRDPLAADRMLADLSELLRLSLRHTATHEVRLGQEVDFLRHYLDIMGRRFGDKLSTSVDVPDALLPALVPGLILQPLVENAIQHGMTDRTDRGQVSIAARQTNQTLILEVADDGPGYRPSPTDTAGGIGLSNTRERLVRLYGDRGQVETAAGTGGGLLVRVSLPLRMDQGRSQDGS